MTPQKKKKKNCKADFNFLQFRRPSFSKFFPFKPLLSYTLRLIVAATQMSIHGQRIPETPLFQQNQFQSSIQY